jgi:hypothetical protein
LHHHNTTVANHIFNKECRHIYFLLTLFGYKVRKHFKNSLGWWVGFGWLGSFGFLKRWFVCREKPNVPNALAKNFLCALGIFLFFSVSGCCLVRYRSVGSGGRPAIATNVRADL